MATANIKEVARHAGVSLGTVSNVLNRPDTVAPATRQRVLDAISTLGYVRNDSARQLRAGRSRTVAIVVLDVANPFFTDVVRGAEQAIEGAGAMLVVCNSGEDSARERRHLELLEEQRVRGVLITPVGHGPQPILDRLIERGIPVVLVDRGTGRANLCSVAVDDVLGGRLAMDHLLDQGHQRIAYLGGPLTIAQVADRHAGAAAALRDRGSTADLRVAMTTSLTVAAGRRAAEELLALPVRKRPTAVFCANDLIALGVLQELTARGVRVPIDVAIVGYDDIEFAGAAAVPLSSVRQPRDQLGRAAAELLLEEAESGDTHRHRHVVFQPELVVRRSSDQPRRTRR
ncbi:LacI family DNA-binding transcriptional regulator [Micromonospora zamorensis]|uniref:LacI family DNA-binding transcriptional regulator n=1 Tax=Micromonospora zamorensis TaxID=709883 RepID=UPI00081F8FC4|nr:LacI family DNA-binding transcriptional regulator [Micromonospora zamorensis]WTE89146.1 LacI family transcriptional regulator [Micromonospora zamorensis]SCG46607.1 transcriptional regulator, LacI family [Micromonospora zamorensis]